MIETWKLQNRLYHHRDIRLLCLIVRCDDCKRNDPLYRKMSSEMWDARLRHNPARSAVICLLCARLGRLEFVEIQ